MKKHGSSEEAGLSSLISRYGTRFFLFAWDKRLFCV
jgi:hypothetical protein